MKEFLNILLGLILMSIFVCIIVFTITAMVVMMHCNDDQMPSKVHMYCRESQ